MLGAGSSRCPRTKSLSGLGFQISDDVSAILEHSSIGEEELLVDPQVDHRLVGLPEQLLARELVLVDAGIRSMMYRSYCWRSERSGRRFEGVLSSCCAESMYARS